MSEKIIIGDRVRATMKGGTDEATFTVKAVAKTHLSASTMAFPHDTWAFEVIEAGPLTKPAGLYGFNRMGTRYIMVTVSGSWFWIDFNATDAESHGPEVTPSHRRDYFNDMVPLYTYRQEFKL